jgi:pilus assembly protein CpaB
MSSIASGVNAERTNRWLLIGALALAVVAGVLVFALLANFGGGDGDSSPAGVIDGGPADVLVAKQTIDPGTNVTEDMFEVVSYDADYVVPQPVTNLEDVAGLTTTVTILQGNQASYTQFVGGADDDFDNLTFKVPDGMLAYSMSVSEDTAVGGLLVPSDRVDIVVRYSTKATPDAQVKQLHTELFAENVQVLARAQTDVEGVASVDGSTDAPAGDAEPVESGAEVRPDDVEADPGANTVTFALTPDQVLRLGQYEVLADGKVTIALRRYGDDAIRNTPPVVTDILEQ